MATIYRRHFVYNSTAVAGGNISYNYPEFWDYYQNLTDKRVMRELANYANKAINPQTEAECFENKVNLHSWMERHGFVLSDTKGHGLNLICREILRTSSELLVG